MAGLSINITDADLQSANTGSYDPVPAGTYNTTIFNVELTEVKSGENAGKPQYKLQFRISEGQFENRRLFTYVPLYKGKAFWKTQAFFGALGYDMKAGEFTVPTPNELSGKPVAVKATIVKDMNGADDNNVAGFAVGKAPAANLEAAGNLAAMGATAVSSSDIWA